MTDVIALALVLLLAVGIVVAIVKAVGRTDRRAAPPTTSTPVAPERSSPPPVVPTGDIARDEELARWVGAGLISKGQADAIRSFEQGRIEVAPPPPPPPPAPPRRVPVVAEALGYLGGALAVSGIGLVVGRYWPDMTVGARLVLSGVAAFALFGAGRLVREQEDPAFARMRAFLWFGSTAATALFVGVAVRDGMDVEKPETVAMACGAAVALQGGLLWWWKDRPLQQLSSLAGLAVFAGAVAAHFGDQFPVGLTIWVLGACYLAVGLSHRTPQPMVLDAAGAVAVIAGAGIAISDQRPGFGLAFDALTALALMSLALVRQLRTTRGEQLLLGIVGAVVAVQAFPSVLGYFTPDAPYATGLGTWSIGALLLFVGARRLTRLPEAVESAGGIAVLVGAALTGAASPGFASLFGIATAVGLIALGTLPGRVLLSVFGSLGLLVNVPWAIGWFFPGEGRAPLLMLVSGALILGVAVWMARMGGRFRRELGKRPDSPTLS